MDLITMLKYPASNVVTSLYNNEWNSFWPVSQLVSAYQHYWYGFSDYVIEDEFPILKYITTDWESSYDGFGAWAHHFRVTWYIPVIVSVLYLALIPVGQKYMSSRPAHELKAPLFWWNAFLAAFSIIGVIRVLPHFIFGIYNNSPMYFICRNAFVAYGRGSVGLWSILFVLSKYAELIDTVFLVLRKKPVPFLHSYHHATVLLLSIGTVMVYGPTGIIMLTVNYCVHAVMYTYYAIAAITTPPSWGKTVTILQIVQMVNGLVMAGAVWYGLRTVPNCEGQPMNLFAIAFIYASYLYLFVQFYINRYIRRTPKADNPPIAKKLD